MTLTYPDNWQVMKKDFLKDALVNVKDKKGLPQEAIDTAKTFAPFVILTLGKPQKIDGVNYNSNINVFVLRVPEGELKDINLDVLIPKQISDIKASIPNVKVTSGLFPLSEYPDIHNYSSQITLADRVINQYQYAYWHPPYFVQVTFSYSHPSDELELKRIIQSMRIEKADNSNKNNSK